MSPGVARQEGACSPRAPTCCARPRRRALATPSSLRARPLPGPAVATRIWAGVARMGPNWPRRQGAGGGG
eukprot:8699526-Lingulodinium_polyedra.AAC.1